MAAQLDIVTKDSTNRSVTLRIVDSTDGTPETGVVWNTAGIDLWYRREGAAVSSVTEATLAALTTAHAPGGFLHISDGEYRFDLPDAAFATGVNHVDVGGTVTGMVVIGGRVRLTDVDLEDATRGGMTALPNANADAALGLPISDAGGLDLDTILDAAISTRLAPTTAARTLDVTATGAAGVDWANVEGQATAVNLSSTTTNLVNTTTTNTDMITAAAVNAEVDTALADINLDHLVFTATAIPAVTAGTFLDQIMDDGTATFDRTTDSLQAKRDRGDAAWITATGFSTHSAADVWTTGGRTVTAATNITSSGGVINVTAGVVDDVTTVATLTGHTAQTGDNYARLGAPAGASVSADVAAVQADTDDIQLRLPAALTKGTADSGSTTTMVDAIRTEADTDYWKYSWIRFTSGTITGQTRLITGFTPASDTITFAPATTQAVATNTYEILPAASIDLQTWLGTAPNALVAGAMDSDVSAMQTGAVTADAIAANAIGASELATDAIGDAQIATGAIASTAFAAGAIDAAAIANSAIDAATFAAGAIDSTAIAADAIGSSELATTAVNEIRDSILADATTFNGADIATILTDTGEIGTAGAGLTDLGGMSTGMKAEVAVEVGTGLRDNGIVATKATIQTVTSQTQLIIPTTDDAVDDNAYNGCLAILIDGTDPNQRSFRMVTGYTASTREVVIDSAPDFTVTTADTIVIAPLSIGALRPTTLAATLDVAATGEAGVDLGNVTGTLTNANVAWVDANERINVGTWLDTAVTLGAGAPDVNIQSTDDIALSTTQKANVNTEVDGALDTAIPELGVAAPTATPTVRTGIMLPYMALRNKTRVQTSGTDALEIHNDAGTLIAKKLLTDDGSDYEEAEMA